MNVFEGEQGARVRRMAVAVLAVLALYLSAQTIGEFLNWRYIGAGIPPTNVISIDGMGEAVAIPDTAQFSFSIVEKAATVGEAQDAATKKMNAVSQYLEDQSIEDKDIKTTGYNVYPQYEWRQAGCSSGSSFCPPGRQVLTGYEVRQSITVKVRDTKKAGELLTGVGSAGASELSGLTFTIDDDEALKREAREKAITNAKDKAEALADQLGVRIVRVVSFSENTGYPPIPIYGREAFGMGGDALTQKALDVPPGENIFTSSVLVTYEIR